MLPPELAFDPTRAVWPTIRLPVSAVQDLLMVSHAPEQIAIYRDQMRSGQRFPPISVIRLFGRYVIADGHKRFAAFRMLAGRDIVVEVWPWSAWVADLWRQAVANARKNRTILELSVRRPRAAGRLLLTTLLHWKRVAASFAMWASGRHS